MENMIVRIACAAYVWASLSTKTNTLMSTWKSFRTGQIAWRSFAYVGTFAVAFEMGTLINARLVAFKTYFPTWLRAKRMHTLSSAHFLAWRAKFNIGAFVHALVPANQIFPT